MATIEVKATTEATTMAVDHPKKKASAGIAKPKTAKAKKASTHPPFYAMVSDAIVTLKERGGSSQYAIQKFAEEKHKQLPLNFRKQLLTQLKKFAASGKLVKVKNSYKLPATKAPAAKPKPTTAASKSTAKKAVSKAAKPVTKPKAKTVAKPKSAASKPKATAVKRKAAVKPKAKPAKVAKKSAASSPSSKKAPVKAKSTKKVAAPVKKAGVTVKKAGAKPKKVKKLSSVKSPAKRSSARKAAK